MGEIFFMSGAFQPREVTCSDCGEKIVPFDGLVHRCTEGVCWHDWCEALPPPYDLPGTPDVCMKCGRERVFKRS